MNINKLYEIVKREEERLEANLRYTKLNKGEWNIFFIENPREDNNIHWIYPWNGEGLAGASPSYRKVEGGIMIGLEFQNDLTYEIHVDEEFVALSEKEKKEL